LILMERISMIPAVELCILYVVLSQFEPVPPVEMLQWTQDDSSHRIWSSHCCQVAMCSTRNLLARVNHWLRGPTPLKIIAWDMRLNHTKSHEIPEPIHILHKNMCWLSVHKKCACLSERVPHRLSTLWMLGTYPQKALSSEPVGSVKAAQKQLSRGVNRPW
jgi:hypothetical protein